jgi:diguanylate cyclase (GGDEF)-like protein
MILLLAVGCVLVSRVISSNMLRADATETTNSWAETLVEEIDISAVIAGMPRTDAMNHLLTNASRIGSVYRYGIWSTSGRLIFVSERDPSSRVWTSIAERHGQRIADSVLSGSAFSEIGTGTPPEDPSYLGETLLPIKKDGKVIGIFDIYIDQTADRALYQRSFLSTELIIILAVLFAGGFPGYLVYRKMLAVRTARTEAVYLAEHDHLTGIANRGWLAEWAKATLAWTRRNNTHVAALLIDMDRFKEINDSFGHSAGDEVLKAFALRLQSTIRAEDMVARLGGDEFVILQVGMAQPSGAGFLAKRLLEKLSEPYDIAGMKLSCHATIGVAIAPTDAHDWDQLLSCADAAMYKVKAEGGNNICFFETGMDAIFRERHRIETDLRRALETNAFQLAYQPLFNFHETELIGFEALLRWPDGWKPTSPATFIPVAEESGLIVPIGLWVLDTACKAAVTWTKPLKIAVNLSPVQFRHCDIVAVVQQALTTSGLDPTRLELEVTESLLLKDTDAVFGQLVRLRAMGVSIALDDFGTGYSSLAYLWKFPFDTVKIDRSFVMEMDLDPKAEAIVNTIVALGKTLNLKVTAEGVETPAQAEALALSGCDQVQGYLFGRPLPSSSANAMVNAASVHAMNL